MQSLSDLILRLGRYVFGGLWSNNRRYQGLQLMVVSFLLAVLAAVTAAGLSSIRDSFEVSDALSVVLDVAVTIVVGLLIVAFGLFIGGLVVQWIAIFNQTRE